MKMQMVCVTLSRILALSSQLSLVQPGFKAAQ